MESMAAVYPDTVGSMCGRFVSASPPDEIAAVLRRHRRRRRCSSRRATWRPTNDVYAITSDGGVRRVEAFHWGLVPMWAKDPKVGAR